MSTIRTAAFRLIEADKTGFTVTCTASKITLVVALNPDERRQMADALRGREPGDEYVDWKAMYEQAVQERDALNTRHSKPQPYDQGGVRGADSLLYRAERERDAAVARAEAAERERDIAETYRRTVEQQAANVGMPLPVSRADVERVVHRYIDGGFDELHVSRAKSTTDAFMALLSGSDPAVHVVRESDLPAARVDGDYYAVASAKGDYKWPQHGPSWWAGRAQDALAEAARYTALARLAADREATVDPVEELAEQIETATRAAIRQACDDLAGVVPALDPLAVEQAMEVRAASRKVAAHVLGQEATR